MTTTNPSRLAREIAEMASAQRRLGIMDEAGVVTLFEGGRMGPLAPAVQAS